ncbi:MAG: glycosyltransferase [bacterium]
MSRALLIDLDFRDFVYSYLWGRAVQEGCARRQLPVDVITVHPAARRSLADELGVPKAAVEPSPNGTTVYIEQADEARSRAAIDTLLGRQPYDTLILNCEAPLFMHLMLARGDAFAGARWLVYDRHLHEDLRAHDADAALRDRMVASRMHLFTIEEIATGAGPPPGQRESTATRWRERLRNRLVAAGLGRLAIAPLFPVHGSQEVRDERVVGSFKRLGLTERTIHLQPWPMDDAFFAPQPRPAASGDCVVFSGGDSGRDYATLFAAIDGLPLQLRLCANRTPTPLPPNVTILPRLALHQFRDEMARADIVVVPLSGQPPVSGITVIAMAKMLARPVIASESAVVRMHIRWQGDGGLLCPMGDAPALRAQLATLLRAPAERERLGHSGRAHAATALSLNAFVERMLACDEAARPG